MEKWAKQVTTFPCKMFTWADKFALKLVALMYLHYRGERKLHLAKTSLKFFEHHNEARSPSGAQGPVHNGNLQEQSTSSKILGVEHGIDGGWNE